jgi:hypothetical protein
MFNQPESATHAVRMEGGLSGPDRVMSSRRHRNTPGSESYVGLPACKYEEKECF